MVTLTDNLTHVLIFKTNISTETEKQLLAEVFRGNESIDELSVDLEDIDKVLRIVSSQMQPNEVIEIVKQQGFFCEELE